MSVYSKSPRRARMQVGTREGWICWICRYPVRKTVLGYPTPLWDDPTIEHEIPRVHGGTNGTYNLHIAHWTCNNFRGSLPITDVLRGMARLRFYLIRELIPIGTVD